MVTLRKVLEKYQGTNVEIGQEDQEMFTISEALECFSAEKLDREVVVRRPDEGEDQSYRFVWFVDRDLPDDENYDPDYLLYHVPLKKKEEGLLLTRK